MLATRWTSPRTNPRGSGPRKQSGGLFLVSAFFRFGLISGGRSAFVTGCVEVKFDALAGFCFSPISFSSIHSFCYSFTK